MESIEKMPLKTEKASAKEQAPFFHVMDQQVAYRLASEGFKIINVIPSTKYASEWRFIFGFSSSPALRKRFKEILSEVEKEKIKRENPAENDEKEAKNLENCTKKGTFCTVSEENQDKAELLTVEDFRKGLNEIIDKLASLEALGNCTLSNVSAISFFERLHSSKEG